jgi:hypothetical protein
MEEDKCEEHIEDKRTATLAAKRAVMIFIIASILIIGGLYYISIQQNNILKINTIYYMYTDECPNCVIVKQWMIDNNFEEIINTLQINFTKLNMDNSLSLPFFNRATKECQLPLASVGVPFVFHNGSCFIGRIEVIDHLNETIRLI